MKRAILFTLLLGFFVLLTFPHELVVRRLLDKPLAQAGYRFTLGTAGFSLPFGYQVTDLRIVSEDNDIKIEALYVSPFGRLKIDSCGGTVDASLRSEETLTVEIQQFQPSECFSLEDIVLEGRFSGKVEAAPFDLFDRSVLPSRGSFDLVADGGRLGGIIPTGGSSNSAPIGIGEWEYERAEVAGSIEDSTVTFTGGKALVEGVEIVLQGGTFGPVKAGKAPPPLKMEFSARAVADTTRAKAVIGMLPKATESQSGWRTYRIRNGGAGIELIGLK